MCDFTVDDLLKRQTFLTLVQAVITSVEVTRNLNNVRTASYLAHVDMKLLSLTMSTAVTVPPKIMPESTVDILEFVRAFTKMIRGIDVDVGHKFPELSSWVASIRPSLIESGLCPPDYLSTESE